MRLLRHPRRVRARSSEGGYMLLVLMIAVAVLVIGLTQAAYNYKRMILRDREVEMIHRGEQYERAIKRFYRKTGRYPISIDQLENFNKVRFLRKRYKDPMSPDGEWKLVRPTDIRITATGISSATVNVNGDKQGEGADAASGSGDNSGSSNDSTSGSSPSTGSSFGGNSGTSGTTGTSTFTGTTVSGGTQSGSGSLLGGSSPTNGQVLGGGDVYGVVSKSKKEGIHSFGDKSKYSEWFFIYVPAQDRGQLLVGPYNPKAFVGTFGSATGTNPAGTQGTGNQGTGSSTTGTGVLGSGTQGGTGTTGTGDGGASTGPQQ